MHCLTWYIKNGMHCIIFLKRIIIHKDTLYKYDEKDVKTRFEEQLNMLIQTLNFIALLISSIYMY